MGVDVTLATLKTKLGYMLGDPDETTYTAAKKTAAINLARDLVGQLFLQWPGKSTMTSVAVSVVSGTETYALADEIYHIEKVIVLLSDGTYRPLTPIDFADIESYDLPASTPDSYPAYYYRSGETIGFKPKPTASSTVTVFYSLQQDDLAADGTAITMPPWVRNLILFKAADYLCGWQGDMKAKQAHAADFAEANRQAEITMVSWQNQDQPRVKTAIWESHIPYSVRW